MPPADRIQEYLKEKIDWRVLESFRKFEKKGKQGMAEKAREGRVMNRAPFGYKLEKKHLIIDNGKKLTVEKIFLDFLNEDTSLNKLAERHGFSVNGIKKILKNFTYIGKVKFSGQILQGRHEPIITSELFNKVQSKIEKLNLS